MTDRRQNDRRDGAEKRKQITISLTTFFFILSIVIIIITCGILVYEIAQYRYNVGYNDGYIQGTDDGYSQGYEDSYIEENNNSVDIPTVSTDENI